MAEIRTEVRSTVRGRDNESQKGLAHTMSEHASQGAMRLRKTVTQHAEYVIGELQPKPVVAQPDLARAVAADVVAAGVTSFAISPVVVICDTAVVQAAAKRSTMSESIRNSLSTMATRPLKFFGSRGFCLVWGIYTMTYGVSNLMQTSCKRIEVDGALPTFLATAAVNIPSSVFQDRCFTAWFGTPRTTGFGLITYGLWAARDMATVLGSFTLPGLIAAPIEQATGASAERARFAAQILVPSAVAVAVHPPLHLLAIDFYNRPSLAIAERMPLLGSLVPSTALLRFARIMPAFGFGGIINSRMKDFVNGSP